MKSLVLAGLTVAGLTLAGCSGSGTPNVDIASVLVQVENGVTSTCKVVPVLENINDIVQKVVNDTNTKNTSDLVQSVVDRVCNAVKSGPVKNVSASRVGLPVLTFSDVDGVPVKAYAVVK